MKVDVKFAESAESFGVKLNESAEGFNVGFSDIKTLHGKSAYEIAVENGFVGTEADWLESLHGKDGEANYNIGPGLQLNIATYTLSVDTVDVPSEIDARPITSQGVYNEFAVINALLKTI